MARKPKKENGKKLPTKHVKVSREIHKEIAHQSVERDIDMQLVVEHAWEVYKRSGEPRVIAVEVDALSKLIAANERLSRWLSAFDETGIIAEAKAHVETLVRLIQSDDSQQKRNILGFLNAWEKNHPAEEAINVEPAQKTTRSGDKGKLSA